MRRFQIFLSGLLCAALLRAPFAGAQPGLPVGDDFQVNVYTTASQFLSTAGVAADGTFVIAWASRGSTGNDSSGYSVQGRRFAADGTAIGSEFQVNSYTASDQMFPALAAAGPGFVVAWQSNGSLGGDTSNTSVQARRLDAAGSALGADFQVNTFAGGAQGYPRLAARAAGDFVVVWQSDGSAGSDDSGYSIQGQRFAADGTPIALEFQINSYTDFEQDRPVVAMAADGAFVVVWVSAGSFGSDSSSRSIQAQRFDPDGMPAGGELQVNAYTTSTQSQPSVAMLPQGGFVVAWRSDGSDGGDTSSYSIRARRFDSDGVPAASEFQVNTYTTSFQIVPGVAASSEGFVVVWESPGSAAGDTAGRGVLAQRYLPGGDPVRTELQVNTYTTGDQFSPAIAAGADGSFVATWSSLGSSGNDGSVTSVQGRRFAAPAPLFADGFESGDASAW